MYTAVASKCIHPMFSTVYDADVKFSHYPLISLMYIFHAYEALPSSPLTRKDLLLWGASVTER